MVRSGSANCGSVFRIISRLCGRPTDRPLALFARAEYVGSTAPPCVAPLCVAPIRPACREQSTRALKRGRAQVGGGVGEDVAVSAGDCGVAEMMSTPATKRSRGHASGSGAPRGSPGGGGGANDALVLGGHDAIGGGGDGSGGRDEHMAAPGTGVIENKHSTDGRSTNRVRTSV
jgi:hypothetical protein